MTQTLFIDGVLPGMNEIIDVCRRSPHLANNHKKKWQKIIGYYIRFHKIKPVRKVKFSFIWIEKERRRDKDNISSGGRKYILDALKEMGVIKNDGWAYIDSWTDQFVVANEWENSFKPGVMVHIEEVEDGRE